MEYKKYGNKTKSFYMVLLGGLINPIDILWKYNDISVILSSAIFREYTTKMKAE